MKFPLSWLKEYIDLNLSPEHIAKLLTFAGIEVESIERVGFGLERVVVGKVLRTEKHPNADKLTVASVSDGKETYQVVCGAPNCRDGILVAFAMEGAVLRDAEGSFTIKKSKLRGVESSGMLCSAAELHIGEESDKILELSNDLEPGQTLSSIYEDTVFEIGLTPNLGHCSSIAGIARELSAATGLPIKPVAMHVDEDASTPISKMAHVEVADPKACPRYSSRVIKNIKVGPSPEWLQRRLLLAGLRPINNIVDITNYVVLEMGQPLHAFDYDTLSGHQVIVRRAKDGEKFVTLDDKERLLSPEELLICDKEKAVALAGIMGGANSEVKEGTSTILLESAHFHPSVIRRSSKRLGLMTDASKRFERHTDPNGTIAALERAATLIQQISGGEVCQGVIDIKAAHFSEKQIECRIDRVNKILGTQLSASEVEAIFKKLGMMTSWKGNNLLVTVPTYRADIGQEIDLIEEVARLYGYDNITRSENRYQTSTLESSPIFLFEREIRTRMLSEGFQEFLTCDLIGPTLLDIVQDYSMPPEATIKVLNPTSIEQSILRTSMLPGLLQIVKYNSDHQNHDIKGFEVGRIHFKKGDQYKEQSVLGIVMTGKTAPHYWGERDEEFDFFDLKGAIENLLKELGIPQLTLKRSAFSTFHPGRQASLFVGELEIGTMGEVHPSIQRRLDVNQRIYFAEFSLHDLMQVRAKTQMLKELPIFPASERDWTVTVSTELPMETIFNLIEKQASGLLEKVSLLDVYKSEKLGHRLQNVTLRFVYRQNDKTIEQEIVEREHQRIVDAVSNQIQK